MAKPNIFYAYTESYPPSMHASQLWKYNNCNSFPKVGTSVYISAKNAKTSCLLSRPTPPRKDGLLLVAALFSHGGDVDVTGFSNGSIPGAGYSAYGSLTPSSVHGTAILGAYTLDYPQSPHVPPQQIHIAIGGTTPTSITFMGGDLNQLYTLKTADAHVSPPTTGTHIWVWLNQGFALTPGVAYTLFLNY